MDSQQVPPQLSTDVLRDGESLAPWRVEFTSTQLRLAANVRNLPPNPFTLQGRSPYPTFGKEKSSSKVFWEGIFFSSQECSA